jgi:tetratricopeptide (TPR) repeat protein
MNIDATKGKDALLILESYSASETDAAQKSKTQAILADALSRMGDLANAVIVYRKILETSPDNADALGGLGLSLVGLGSSATPPNTAMMQEGLNLMQRFTEVAPDNHSLKASVKDAVDYLKTQQLTPQKTNKTTTKKKT